MKKMNPTILKIVSSRAFFVAIIVTISVLAALISQSLLNQYQSSVSFVGEQSLVIRDNVSTNERKLLEASSVILEKEQLGFVRLYSADRSFVSHGVILTNDGWILSIENSAASTVALVRSFNGKEFSVEQSVVDPKSDLIYHKVTSKDMNPVTLATSYSYSPLESVLIADSYGAIRKVQVSSYAIKKDVYLSASSVNRFIQTDSGSVGEYLFNDKAELIGLVSTNTSIHGANSIDSNYIRTTLNQVLRTAQIVDFDYELHYVDLSSAFVPAEISSNNQVGALITNAMNPNPGQLFIIDSPLYRQGLRQGDIILSANGDLINEKNTFSDILQRNPGEIAWELGILRGGESITLDIKFNAPEQPLKQ